MDVAERAKLRVSRLSGKASKKVNDVRTPGQIDRDRVLYCTAFRRLAEVTQVVQAAEGHQFHNRLTHVLKVAQIGRRIAERLLKGADRDLIETLGGLDPDVVETAGLAHDLGHPPFGHVAEYKLLELADEVANTNEGFEGNAQSFHIVTKTAARAEESGLDLTRASLNAILKYPWLRGQNGHQKEKWGVYSSDMDEFTRAREAALHLDQKTLEAELMDWADDVAYAIYDLDDFYRAGMVPLDRLLDRSEAYLGDLYDDIKARWTRQGRADYVRNFAEYQKRFDKLLALLGTRSLLKRRYDGRRLQRAALRDVTSILVGRYAGAISLNKQVSRKNPQPVKIDPGMKMEVEMIKQLAWTYVIENPALAAQQEGQKQIIETLYRKFWDAAKKKNWDIFPASLRFDLTEKPVSWSSEPARRNRFIIDFISSMTEAQAISMYSRLTGYSSLSVTQDIV